MECLLEYFLWMVCFRGLFDSLNKHGDKSLNISTLKRLITHTKNQFYQTSLALIWNQSIIILSLTIEIETKTNLI